MAVVQTLNDLCTNDQFWGACLCNLFMYLARFGEHAVHILGLDNKVVDAVSRVMLKKEMAGRDG